MMSLLIAIMFDLHHTSEFVNCLQTRSSPLILAVEKGYLDIVKLLLENKNLEIVKLLLGKGADSNIGDNVSISLCAGDVHLFLSISRDAVKDNLLYELLR